MSFSRDRIKESMDVKVVTEEPDYLPIGYEPLTVRAIWDVSISSLVIEGFVEGVDGKVIQEIPIHDLLPGLKEVYEVKIITKENG